MKDFLYISNHVEAALVIPVGNLKNQGEKWFLRSPEKKKVMGKTWSFLRPQLHTDWCTAKWLSCEWFQKLWNINWIEFHIKRNGRKKRLQDIQAKFCGSRSRRLLQFQMRRNSITLQVFMLGNVSTTSYICLGKKKQLKPCLLNGKRTDPVFAEAGVHLMHHPPLALQMQLSCYQKTSGDDLRAALQISNVL